MNIKPINTEIIMNLYQKIENLRKTLLSNENKANELRKLFELLVDAVYEYDASFYTPLAQHFYDYTQKSNKRHIFYVGKELIKNLNNWSHHTVDTLDDKALEQYFAHFKGIIKEITGIDEAHNSSVQINKFALDDLKLNEKQLSAARAKERIVLVNAGPGTGKTYLIVGRILESISSNHEKKIFALSFTNKAANELQDRVDKELFGTNLFNLRSNIFIGTIHSFSLYIIHKYFKIQNIAFEYSVIDEFEYNEIKINLDNEIDIGEYLSENKLLTFDGIVTKFIEMLVDDYNFQEFLKDEIDEIIVDEAQDLDKNQYEILKLINKKVSKLSLFFVGDQRQNIYAFKGGSLSHFQNLIGNEVYQEVILDLSYRCPQNILNFVNQISFNDSNNNKLVNALNNKENNLEVLTFEDKKAEAHGIVQLIKKNVENQKYSDVAIIFTSSFYFKEISDALNANKISFKLFGGQNYLDANIRHLRNILNAIYKDDSYSLSSIMNP